MAEKEIKAWYDDIDAATLQRIKTYSAFNDYQSKNWMMQTLYEAIVTKYGKEIGGSEQLTKAKEIINDFLDFESGAMERGCYIADDIRRRAEDFIKEEL